MPTQKKLTPIVLNGMPSRRPHLISFSEVHQHDGLVRGASKGDHLVADDAIINPAVAPVAAPVDTSAIPGVALSTAVQGFIAGLSVTAFPSGLSTDDRAAVLNAITYCTLAANGDLKSNSALNYVAQWASYLPSASFALTSSGSGSYNAGGINVSLDQALLDCVAAMSTDVTSVNIMKDVINALKTLPENQGALTLFSHNTIRNGIVNVATTSVTQAAAATPIQMVMTIYNFAFSSTETRVLWITVNDTTSQLSYQSITATLNETTLPTLEPLLTAKLNSFYTTQIATVELSST